MAVTIHILPVKYDGTFTSSYLLLKRATVLPFYCVFVNYVGIKGHCVVTLICISLVINDFQCSYVYGHFTRFWVNYSFISIFYYLLPISKNSWYFKDINLLSVICDANIFLTLQVLFDLV